MRWTVELDNPSLQCTQVSKIFDPGNFLEQLKDQPETLKLSDPTEEHSAQLWILASEKNLDVVVLAEGLQDTQRPDYPEKWYRDHIVVFFNPGNDNGTHWTYSVDDESKVSSSAQWHLPGEESHDGKKGKAEDPPPAEGGFQRLEAHRYLAWLRFPIDTLGVDPQIPTGFRIKVCQHEECVPPPLEWPEPLTWSQDVPIGFGKLYRQAPTLQVNRVVFEKPIWGGETSRVRLAGSRSESAPRQGTLQAEVELPDDSKESLPKVPWTSQTNPDSFEIELPVVFPHRAKWASDNRYIARLNLTIQDDNGGTLWKSSYPFGFDAGIIVREQYGARSNELPYRPHPSDPDFVDRFRAYVLSRIPDYQWRTTRDGAPSDFFLEDPEGKANLNLMKPGYLDEVVEMLATRFPDWQDALCASAAWCYHPLITRHTGTWSGPATSATLESIPRLGGCICNVTSRLVASLAEPLGQRLGVELKGYTMGLRGHLTALVQSPLGKVVIDGMHGVWYHTLDRTRLATLEEMREIDQIVRSVWYHPRAHGHEFFYKVYDQIIRPVRQESMEWPPSKKD